jgi:hypothetical protein
VTAELRCRIWASWEPGLIPPEAEQDAPEQPRPVPEESLTAAASSWRPPKPSYTFDPETFAALRASREGVPMTIDPDGLEFPSMLPLCIDHARPPAGTFSKVWREGKVFFASGWADPAAYAELAARTFVSPTFAIRTARLQEMGGLRLATVTRSEVFELSAVADPLLAGTTFYVYKPSPIPDAERFAIDAGVDRVRFSAERRADLNPDHRKLRLVLR